MNILLIIITLNILSVKSTNVSSNVIFSINGDLKIGMFLQNCEQHDVKLSYTSTITNSAIWTINRLNTLQFVKPLTLGLDIINICNNTNYYETIFHMFQEHVISKNYLGIVTPHQTLPSKLDQMLNVLEIPVKESIKLMESIEVVTKVLLNLQLYDDILVFAPNQVVLKAFYRSTRKQWICVRDFVLHNDNNTVLRDETFNGTIVAIGNYVEISQFVNEKYKGNYPNVTLILVPTDGKTIKDVPEDTIIIEPPYSTVSDKILDHPKLLPSPLLFEIAAPILSLTADLPTVINFNCMNESQLIKCIQDTDLKQLPHFRKVIPPDEIIHLLKIEPIMDEFVYNVFKVENRDILNNTNKHAIPRYIHIFSYKIFSGELIEHYEVSNSSSFINAATTCVQKLDKCIVECANFKSASFLRDMFFPLSPNGVQLRPEPWVLAVLTIICLGALLCLSITIFLIVKLCKYTTFEGNPVLTIILLMSVLILFISVIPFCLQSVYYKDVIYITRFLGLSLPYALTFSILLSRTIMLATISKESGFMSHVSGHVQACLQAFIFAVQCAIVIQLSRKCDDVFNSHLLVYVLSYNAFLLLLLICFAPVILKSKRNYNEGKYFTVSILLIAITWCFWLPGYTYLDHTWKEPMICLGLLGTASALLGGVFIPRTYLMMISAAQDRFTSVLPSLATVSSALDIYRANTQPIYDCVNIAAINAARAAAAQPLSQHQQQVQANAPPLPQQDYYGPCRIAQDDFEDVSLPVENCNTQSPDKITRF